jgi:hypothetical protein
MSNIASVNPLPVIAQKIARMFHLAGSAQSASKQPAAPQRPDPNELTAGGYNEAFIMQNWASYSPRH